MKKLISRLLFISLLVVHAQAMQTNTQDIQDISNQLIIAAEKNDFKGVKKLLDQKADPNFQNDAKRTSLHFAYGRLKILTLLLDHKANPNIQDKY